MRLFRLFAVLMLAPLLVGLTVRAWKQNHGGAKPSAENLTAATIDPLRAWRPIGHGQVLNESFDLASARTWTVQHVVTLPGVQSRFMLAGEFAASEPITFAVVDAVNAERMNKGYPPIIAYQSGPGKLATAYPSEGSVWGFFRPPPESPDGFPTTTSELVLRLFAKVAESHRPPARVTAEIHVDGECLCTPAEAARFWQR